MSYTNFSVFCLSIYKKLHLLATVIRKKRALVDFSEIIEFNIEHPFMFKILQRQTSESSPLNSSSLELFAGKIQEIVTSTIENTTNQMKDEL